MIMVIGPHKKKAEAKAEHRKRRPDEIDGVEGIDVGGIEGGTDITASTPAEETAQA